MDKETVIDEVVDYLQNCVSDRELMFVLDWYGQHKSYNFDDFEDEKKFFFNHYARLCAEELLESGDWIEATGDEEIIEHAKKAGYLQ